MLSIEDVKDLQIPLQDISLATKGFANENLLANGGFGRVYKGISEKHGHIAVKRYTDRGHGQGDPQFKTEIAMLSNYEHENIVSLVGFCDEEGEKILVYKYESNSSLDKHLNSEDLTWIQRLQICLDVGRGLNYLHGVGPQHRILHRDIKSSNILLDENWKPKISDFGLSRIGPANTKHTFLISNVCGTLGYIDPEYYMNGYLTQKSDVYSFGVVLWEVLCGRLAYVKDERVILSVSVQRHYISRTLHSFIPSYLQNQINTESLLTFSNIAYQCLKNVEERPTMRQVVEQLQIALDNQLEVKKPEEDQEAKPIAGEEKKGEDSKDPQPPPPRQEIVLSTFMHCDNCARKVRQCLKGFEGVEGVVTDCKTHQVVVKGKKADPLKVLERVQKKIHRKVELLWPVPNLQAVDLKKSERKEPPEKKDDEVKKPEKEAKPDVVEESKDLLQEVVLSLYLHCDGCAVKVRKRLSRINGVEDVTTDVKNSKVIVKGTKVDPLKVLQILQMAIDQKVELLSPVLKPPAEEPKKPEQEEPSRQEEKKADAPHPVTTVVLELRMHCETCARETTKCIQKMQAFVGVESVVTEPNNPQVAVKGAFSAAELIEYVQKETGKNTVIMKQDPA